MKTTCLTPKAINETLIQSGVRPTIQRVTICEYVLCNADHPTAEEVKTWVNKKFKQVSMATIYNTLNTLVKVGLLQELRLPHIEKTIYDSNTEPHFHAIDITTNKIIELSTKEVDIKVNCNLNIDIESTFLVMYGRQSK